MNEEAKSKIRKLFALGKQGVGGEAENAIRMANELLKKYNLSQYEIDIAQEMFHEGILENWASLLLNQVCINCGVLLTRTHYGNGRPLYKLVGDEINIAVAKELYTYLKDYVLRIVKEHNIKRSELKAIKESITAGICQKLEENKRVWLEGEKTRAKVVDNYKKLLAEDSDKLHNSKQSIENRSSQAYALGYQVNLNKQTSGHSNLMLGR